MNNTTPPTAQTSPLPTFRSLYVPGEPTLRRRYPRDTASLAVTTLLPVR